MGRGQVEDAGHVASFASRGPRWQLDWLAPPPPSLPLPSAGARHGGSAMNRPFADGFAAFRAEPGRDVAYH
ncbi:hypothetical protein [Allosphingosinicella deserti]|uniref:Uncharacterized protein n=1 Tax=Allosphingosinicella deserti TaxID=2116704 RepID=A0A2P7QLM2_9SPHN|nr:hypothetical protein [Sphingomonas deserti]PSJ38872.1 hypothetical protein C7I55_16240 [Sphingomonas deserti]